MMINIMEALYNGRLIPWERRVWMTEERKEIEKNIEREKMYFSKKLSQDDYERFERLEKLYMNSHHSEDVDFYAYSFTLGALLMLEIFKRGDDIFDE